MAPSVPLSGALTITGVSGDPERADATVIQSAACSEVDYPGPTSMSDRYRAGAVLRLAASSDVRMSNLRVVGCELGIFVGSASLVLESVSVGDVTSSVVVSDGGDLRASASVFTSEARATGSLANPTPPFAVYAANASLLELTGSMRILNRGLAVGVMVRSTPVEIIDTTIEGGAWGFLVDQETTPDATTRLGPRMVVRDLQAVMGVSGELRAGNLMRGGVARVDGLRIDAVEGDCMQFVLCHDATVANSEFSRCRDAGVALFSSQVEWGPSNRMDVGTGQMGFYLSDRSDTPGSGEPSRLRATAALVSRAGVGAKHIVVQGSVLELMAGAELTGGTVGLLVEGAGRADTVGEFSVTGLSLPAGAPSDQRAVAVVARGSGTRVDLASLSVDQSGEGAPSVGLLVRDGATLGVSSGSVRSASVGALVDALGTLSLDGIEIDGAGVNGVALFGGTASLTAVRVHDGAGVGVLVRDGATLSLDRSVISNNGGSGVEAQAGGRLEIRGSTFEANTGAAVAFYDASGFVASSMFSVGSSLGDFGGEQRADELRVVSTDGASHEVYVGDDGDGTVMPDEENRFELDARAGCDAGGCTLLLGDGMGVNGVVNPNCIVAAAPGGAVHTVVGQNGASMSVVGGAGGTAWADALGGMASDLGLSAGSPGAMAAVPVGLVVPGLDEIVPPF